MTKLLLSVVSQTRYVCAVHSFIRELLLIAVPDLIRGSAYIRNDIEFSDRIDDAISGMTTPTATERDYTRAIVTAACREMSDVCRLLKSACGMVGLESLAAEYLAAAKFRAMLMRKDARKLERLKAIVQERNGKPIKILMDVAAELNDRAANYDGLTADAKRKAATDLNAVMAKVSTIVSGAEARLGRKIDAVGKKLDGIKFKGRRKGKYSDSKKEACLSFMNAAQSNPEIRHSVNTRVTHKAVFNYYRRELAEIGIDTAEKFGKVIHAAQSLTSSRQIKALEAKRDAARKAKRTTRSLTRGTSL